jgi:hypothetical protein
MVRTPHFVVAALLLGAVASAQSFNLDLGTWNPAPSAAFGAAANQPGTWNQIDCIAGTPTALVDLAGAPSAVTIRRTGGSGQCFAFDHPLTLGDDELLLDDAYDLNSTSTFRIAGLAAGDYVVTTYAWAPDGDMHRTGVVVNGGSQTLVGGAWTGAYMLGVTHSVDTVTLAPGAEIVIVVSIVTNFGTFNGVQVHRIEPPITPSCPGDGTVAPCPCGNSGSAGAGCANSLFPAGGALSGAGIASVAGDTFVLSSANLSGGSAVFFQGDALSAPFPVDDGLGCVTGAIVRLATKPVAGNASSYPQPGDLPISVRGALPPAGGQRHYQCFYRNASALFCPPATSNRTNGVTVTWAP